jgi:hypothetical protein
VSRNTGDQQLRDRSFIFTAAGKVTKLTLSDDLDNASYWNVASGRATAAERRRWRMPILVSCSCGKQYQVREEYAGRSGRCPACGRKGVLPQKTKGVSVMAHRRRLWTLFLIVLAMMAGGFVVLLVASALFDLSRGYPVPPERFLSQATQVHSSMTYEEVTTSISLYSDVEWYNEDRLLVYILEPDRSHVLPRPTLLVWVQFDSEFRVSAVGTYGPDSPRRRTPM